MRFQLHKYWRDLLMPVLRQEQPPTVPQAIVLQDQQVLLVQRDHPRFWELPGGGMAPGETPEETVVREVWEETSVRVEVVELLGWYERTGFRAHCAPVYVCRPHSGPPQAQDADTVQARYFPHSTEFSGEGYPSSSKASRSEYLEIEQPVSCGDCASFDFHPTLASVLGPTLIGD